MFSELPPMFKVPIEAPRGPLFDTSAPARTPAPQDDLASRSKLATSTARSIYTAPAATVMKTPTYVSNGVAGGRYASSTFLLPKPSTPAYPSSDQNNHSRPQARNPSKPSVASVSQQWSTTSPASTQGSPENRLSGSRQGSHDTTTTDVMQPNCTIDRPIQVLKKRSNNEANVARLSSGQNGSKKDRKRNAMLARLEADMNVIVKYHKRFQKRSLKLQELNLLVRICTQTGDEEGMEEARKQIRSICRKNDEGETEAI